MNARFGEARRAALAAVVLALALTTAARPTRPAECTESAISAVRALASPAPAGAKFPRLAQGSGPGTMLLSWFEEGRGERHTLRFAAFDGERWSPTRTIVTGDSLFVNWADFPVVAALQGDTLAAAWLARAADGPYAYHVRASVSPDGGRTWKAPVVVHTDRSATEHGFVTFLPEGPALRVVWLDGRKYAGREPGAPGAEMTLRTALLGGDCAVRDERELDGRTCDCCNTAASRAGDGALVAYRDRDENEVRDMAFVLLAEGHEPVRGLLHADDWRIPGCPVNGPALAVDPAGGVAAAWYTEAEDRPRVLFAPASGAGEAFRFAAPVTISDRRPLGRVGIASVGPCEYVVSWLETRGDSADVMARVTRRDGGLGEAVRVGTTSAKRSSGFPQAHFAGGPRPGVVLAWTEPGGRPRVRLVRLELRASR